MDASNCVKGFEDCLQDKYKFNDKRVMFHTALKVVVKKGQEYIRFRIVPFNESEWTHLTREEQREI